MSYNNQTSGTNHAIHFQVSTSTVLSSGDAIPYALLNGTSGHGVTVSSGVITLPKGEWSVIASAETTNPETFQADWYINSTINNQFPKLTEYNSTSTSNLGSTSIVTHGDVTIELRVNAGVTVTNYSDLIIIGVKL